MSAVTPSPAWDDRARGLLARPPRRLLRLLEVLPMGLRQAAATRWLALRPMARSAEEDLVAEVRRCWADAPLPRPLAELVDQARRSALVALATARAAACEGPDASGRWLDIASLAPVEEAAGTGVILLTPTFGSWQRVAPALARRGYRVGLLDARPRQRIPGSRHPAAPGLDLRLLSDRPDEQDAFVRSGGVVVALGDEGTGTRRATGALLGRQARIGTVPFELARRTKAPLRPAFVREEGPIPRLVLEAAVKVGRGDKGLDAAAARWLKGVDAQARRRPDHYLGFLFSRWIARYSDPVPLFADAVPPRGDD